MNEKGLKIEIHELSDLQKKKHALARMRICTCTCTYAFSLPNYFEEQIYILLSDRSKDTFTALMRSIETLRPALRFLAPFQFKIRYHATGA